MTDTAVFSNPDVAAVSARVAIVEDHGLLAQSLAFALTNLGAEVVVVEDLRPSSVLATLEAADLHLVLLDFDLGDAGLGLHLVRPITDLGLRVVMLTGETDPIALAACVEAGAIGIISKSEPFERLIEQVTDVVIITSLKASTGYFTGCRGRFKVFFVGNTHIGHPPRAWVHALTHRSVQLRPSSSRP